MQLLLVICRQFTATTYFARTMIERQLFPQKEGRHSMPHECKHQDKHASFVVYTFLFQTMPACPLSSYVMYCRQHSPLGTKQYNNL